jgi:16S rRNA (guanine(527)-N(7))-methyltransferase RsmG
VTSKSFRLSAADRGQLRVGAAALGVAVDAHAESKLAAYADLLGLWNERVNLVACHSGAELVERHLLDSLAVEPLLRDGGLVADLGTGAGLPGVPLAITSPERRFVLVEIRRRRANFLKEVRRALQLANVEVLEQRAEHPPSPYQGQAVCVVTRAVWSDERIFGIADKWIQETGELIWSRTEPLPASTDMRPFARRRSIAYRIGAGRQRTIDVFERS